MLFSYAEGGAVGKIDDTSDWSSFFIFEPAFFGFDYFYFFSYFLEGDFEGDFGDYLSLLLDLPDFKDLSSPAPFFLLFESLAIFQNSYILNFIINEIHNL